MGTGGGERHDWSALREDYARGGLTEDDLAADPFEMFHRWMNDAIAAQLPSPTRWSWPLRRPTALRRCAWCCSRACRPRASSSSPTCGRARGRSCGPTRPARCSSRGTRWSGRSGWRAPASLLAEDEVAAYFATRPRRSRIGAWASPQSREVAGREELAASYAALEERFGGADGTSGERVVGWGAAAGGDGGAGARCRSLRSGAASGSDPSPSSSGRADRGGCTTASSTAVPRGGGHRRPPPGGPSTASPPDPERRSWCRERRSWCRERRVGGATHASSCGADTSAAAGNHEGRFAQACE